MAPDKKESIFINDEIFEAEVEEVPGLDDIYIAPSIQEELNRLNGVTDAKPKPVMFDVPEGTQSVLNDAPLELDTLVVCPRCTTPLKVAIAISGAESLSFKECPKCGTLINTFKPIQYQADAASRPERYVMLAGGFGSGKSRINIEKVISHLVLIPNARVVVAARTYPAAEATFVKDFFSIMPLRLLRRKNEQKHEWQFTNGAELLIRSFDDPLKLRGINASMFLILEASNVPYDAFELAQNRIRNTAAMIPFFDERGAVVTKYDEKAKMMRPIYAHDARKILIETNPDAGWIKSRFLVDSGTVQYYGSAQREGYRMNAKTDPNKYTMVMATDANPYLPEGFIEEQTRGKSDAYIMQFFYGSFNFAENLVYPNAGARIEKPHSLPAEYNEYGKRTLWYLIGLDYGINDPTAIIYMAYSEEEKHLYVFDELYERGLDVASAVEKHREKMKLHNITNDKLMMLPVFDGRSYNKREANLQTIGDLFNRHNLWFRPSFTFNDARIAKLNGIINAEEITIFSTCEYLIEELTNYKYKMNRDGTPSSKPEDRNNHAINALEFIIMELPLSLNHIDMTAYVPTGTIHKHDTHSLQSTQTNKINKPYNPYERKEGNSNEQRYDNFCTNNAVTLPRLRNCSRNSRTYQTNQTFEREEEDRENIFKAYIPGRHD